MDSNKLNENIISLATKLDKKEMAKEYIKKSMNSNPENLLVYLSYFNVCTNNKFHTFEDIIVCDSDMKKSLLDLLENDLKIQSSKSRLLTRLELLLSEGSEFQMKFNKYFVQYVKQNIPSIFINIKFIYKHQQEKIPLIEEIIFNHIDSIEKEKKLSSEFTSENLCLTPHIIWVYYYAASHLDYIKDTDKALIYINKAIDSTPTVVDFYILKSKILKHAGMLSDSALAYEKAKKLDLGDRYLNAKYAKTLVRNNELEKSLETMKEFIRDPISDENIEHTQCMWYESECGFNYLQGGDILRAHRLFKMIFNHFNTLVEDQFDFYNYCLRRFMINDFANTIEYMDRILDNKYVYIALEAFEVILKYLKLDKNIQKKVNIF
jgi:tetratricopeptide (TPR) repeat protein